MVEEQFVAEEEFTALVAQHHQALLAFIERRVPPEVARSISAEDVLQETLIAMHRQMKRGSMGGEHAYHALYQLARHALIDAIRTVHRVKRGGRRNRVVAGTSIDPFALIPSPNGTPSSACARDELRERIRTAVLNMPGKYGRIMMMRYMDRMTRSDIAIALGIPKGRVSSILFRARGYFRAFSGFESSTA